MPRKEQIEAAAKNVFPNQGHTFNHELAFIQGAQWADANPETLGMREYRRLETKIVTYEAFRAETDEIIMKLQKRVKRLEACIEKEIKRCGDWAEGRKALEETDD